MITYIKFDSLLIKNDSQTRIYSSTQKLLKIIHSWFLGVRIDTQPMCKCLGVVVTPLSLRFSGSLSFTRDILEQRIQFHTAAEWRIDAK